MAVERAGEIPMLYEQTPVNLEMLVREIGIVKREQLVRFFSDVESEKRINYYIKVMIENHQFLYDKDRDLIQWHTTPKQILEEREKRIEAFWIPVSFRSTNVKEIIVLHYPFQFMMITHDDEIYDIAVCYDSSTAYVARRRIEMSMLPEIEDEVNHILLTNEEETGNKLGKYGFDSFCILDEKNEPHYFEWD